MHDIDQEIMIGGCQEVEERKRIPSLRIISLQEPFFCVRGMHHESYVLQGNLCNLLNSQTPWVNKFEYEIISRKS